MPPRGNRVRQYYGTQATALDMTADTVTLGADAAVTSVAQASMRLGFLNTAQDMTVRPDGACRRRRPWLRRDR